MRRDKHSLPAPPVARVHNQMTDRPRVIVNEEIFQVADLTVTLRNMVFPLTELV